MYIINTYAPIISNSDKKQLARPTTFLNIHINKKISYVHPYSLLSLKNLWSCSNKYITALPLPILVSTPKNTKNKKGYM